MKENMKKPNSKTNVWKDVVSVWYTINRKTLIELYDSMPKRVHTAFKA